MFAAVALSFVTTSAGCGGGGGAACASAEAMTKAAHGDMEEMIDVGRELALAQWDLPAISCS